MVQGLPQIKSMEQCEACIYGKQRKNPFPEGTSWRALGNLDLVHGDLCGLMKTKSLGVNWYFMLLTDDHSRMSWVFFL